MTFRDGKDALNQVEKASEMYNHNVEKSVQIEGSADPSLASPFTPCFRPFPYSMWSLSMELLSL